MNNEQIQNEFHELQNEIAAKENSEAKKRSLIRAIKGLKNVISIPDDEFSITLDERDRAKWISLLSNLRAHKIISCLQYANFSNNLSGISELSKYLKLDFETTISDVEEFRSLGVIYVDKLGFMRSPPVKVFHQVHDWFLFSDQEMDQIRISTMMRISMNWDEKKLKRLGIYMRYAEANVIVSSEEVWADFVIDVHARYQKFIEDSKSANRERPYGVTMQFFPLVNSNFPTKNRPENFSNQNLNSSNLEK